MVSTRVLSGLPPPCARRATSKRREEKPDGLPLFCYSLTSSLWYGCNSQSSYRSQGNRIVHNSFTAFSPSVHPFPPSPFPWWSSLTSREPRYNGILSTQQAHILVSKGQVSFWKKGGVLGWEICTVHTRTRSNSIRVLRPNATEKPYHEPWLSRLFLDANLMKSVFAFYIFSGVDRFSKPSSVWGERGFLRYDGLTRFFTTGRFPFRGYFACYMSSGPVVCC